MKTLDITLSSAGTKEFVNIVSRYPFDADLRSGRFLVDAKSLLGVLSLDLSKVLVLEIHEDECDELVTDLEKFTA
ncbi:MAG: HPr family phosphocarrier protein [Firmicutes bacterium]|nr:HPr family phosphocarrier protein [Bacillota bacterium]